MNWKKCSFCIFFITGFLLGTVASTLGLTTLVSYRMDKFHERITYLEAVIEDKDTKLIKLSESLNKKKYVLQDIEIIITTPLEEMVKLSLRKHISEKYGSLIGKEIKNIDVEMVEEVIDNRIMRLDDKEYRIKFDKLILSEALKLWVQIETTD